MFIYNDFRSNHSLRKDHRPFSLKRLSSRINHEYVKRFVTPQFDHLGHSPMVVKPRSCEIHGHNIQAGNYLHLISNPCKPVRLTTWSSKQSSGHIRMGDFCLISPGVEITSALSISIGDNTMIAAESTINDCDWHGIYNRTRPFRCTKAVIIGENVWIGARSIIGKGVTIGNNSVIGAGSVVVSDIPENVVAAGNPAKIVKSINPNRRILKREYLFKKGDYYWENQIELDKYLTGGNTFWGWFKSLISPTNKD